MLCFRKEFKIVNTCIKSNYFLAYFGKKCFYLLLSPFQTVLLTAVCFHAAECILVECDFFPVEGKR